MASSLADGLNPGNKAAAAKALIVTQFASPDRAQHVAEASTVFSKTSDPSVSHGNALARHLAVVGDTGLYPKQPFDPTALQRAGHIDGWIDFSLNSLAGPSQDLRGSASAIVHSLEVLEAHLAARTYVVGECVSLADVVLVSDLLLVFEKVLDPAARQRLPNTQRWFLTLVGQPRFAGVLGSVVLASTTATSAGSSGGSRGVKDGAAGAAGAGGGKKDKKEKEKKPKQGGEAKPKQAPKGGGGAQEKKKESKLGISTKRSENFGEWYSEVVVASEMVSYYDVSGCYIIRPWAFSVWESIVAWFDAQIKLIDVENANFPLFVTEDALNKEKDHVEGFAAEVAWVTKSGRNDLPRPIAIRPTSETVMYPYYAQWIRSWRDLPLKLNQWTNVVRWEFSNPTPFIRTREFLWQEGHTAYATKEEADKDVYHILDLYAKVYTHLLAVPVTKGYKSAAEKFAGSLYSTSVEGFVEATGRGIQGGTSHALGQNFSKMFGIEFEAQDKTTQLAWQNSWGLSTRTIGVMIMVHGDDKGLVMPPRVAPLQVIVVPIPNVKLSTEQTERLYGKARDFVADLKAAGVRCKADARDNYTPGWKYNYWEQKGVPIRLELGPKDLEKETVLLVRRDTGAKEPVPWTDVAQRVPQLLDQIQNDMYERAAERYVACTEKATTWEQFMAALERKHMVLAPWCNEQAVEKQVKADSTTTGADGVVQMGAKTLCIPLEQPELPPGTKCFKTGRPAKNWALWGRSY